MKSLMWCVWVGVAALLGCVRTPRMRARTCPPGELWYDKGDLPEGWWPPFAAVRFVAGGQLLTPPGPLAMRTPGDCRLQRPLRFGSLFLEQGSYNNAFQPQPRWVGCAHGRDSMRVVLFPPHLMNVLWDSVPFRPGTYRLSVDEHSEFGPGRPPQVEISFAEYYRQHADELARDNPFAGLRFPTLPPEYQPLVGRYGRPDSPTDIFAHLLLRTTYLRVRHYRLVPVHRVRWGRYRGHYVPDNPADWDRKFDPIY